ncbi:MAG: hypothetical protein IJ092_02905, partial [Atopobiaceae bacterium]|nr:hypothetical protein [Atopobiaceae bacterium]
AAGRLALVEQLGAGRRWRAMAVGWPLRSAFAAIPGCWPGRALPTSGCPQPVQSTSQRGRQRLAAAATQQPTHATGIRLSATSPAADAQQRPTEAAPGPRQPLSQPEPASSTRERLRAPGSPPDAACHPGRRRT